MASGMCIAIWVGGGTTPLTVLNHPRCTAPHLSTLTPLLAAEHDPSLITDSPAGSVASSNLPPLLKRILHCCALLLPTLLSTPCCRARPEPDHRQPRRQCGQQQPEPRHNSGRQRTRRRQRQQQCGAAAVQGASWPGGAGGNRSALLRICSPILDHYPSHYPNHTTLTTTKLSSSLAGNGAELVSLGSGKSTLCTLV